MSTVDHAKATAMTKIRCAKIDPRVLPEISAKGVFLSQPPAPGDATPVTSVNLKTLVEREGRKSVSRIAGESVGAVAVTSGRTLGDALEITGSALKPGDRLARCWCTSSSTSPWATSWPLMGPSGSGKSALLNLIAGIDQPSSGTIEIGGVDIATLSDGQLADWRTANIGFILARRAARLKIVDCLRAA